MAFWYLYFILCHVWFYFYVFFWGPFTDSHSKLYSLYSHLPCIFNNICWLLYFVAILIEVQWTLKDALTGISLVTEDVEHFRISMENTFLKIQQMDYLWYLEICILKILIVLMVNALVHSPSEGAGHSVHSNLSWPESLRWGKGMLFTLTCPVQLYYSKQSKKEKKYT